MDEPEALAVMSEELALYRVLPYADLLPLIDRSSTVERTGPSGTKYQIQVQVLVDDPKRNTLRVAAAVDDGTFWRAVSPTCTDFIIAPDGSFVGE
jgi:hypothetical protein